jgi:hypothetical protein
MMEEKFGVPVSKEIYDKLKKLADFLNSDLKSISNLAFEEFFNLIKEQPETFLEIVGQIDDLKKILE